MQTYKIKSARKEVNIRHNDALAIDRITSLISLVDACIVLGQEGYSEYLEEGLTQIRGGLLLLLSGHCPTPYLQSSNEDC